MYIEYTKRKREKKTIVQDHIVEWLEKQSNKYPVLKSGNAITLCGPDPMNAIHALRGTDPKRCYLYENNDKAYHSAKEEFGAFEKKWNLKINKKTRVLVNEDIYNHIHEEVSCFYYDFCATHKNIDWAHIAMELKNQMKQNRSFSVVFTLSLRGKGCGTKNTQKVVNDFCKTLSESDNTYFVKKIKKAQTYHGGPTGRGAPMYVWAGVWLKGDNMGRIRKNFPGLFDEEKQQKEKRMSTRKMKTTTKRVAKTTTRKVTKAKKATESVDVTKEMIHTLLKNKKRQYTNADIAGAMGISVRKVAAMAAWHTGKLAEKRK